MDEDQAESEWRTAFSARLKEKRGERTHDTMAELLCIDGPNRGSTYAKWENRGSQPPIRLLPKICKIFGVTLEWLIAGDKEAPKPQKIHKKKRASA